MTTTKDRITPARKSMIEVGKLFTLLEQRLETLESWAANGETVKAKDLVLARRILDATGVAMFDTISAYKQEMKEGVEGGRLSLGEIMEDVIEDSSARVVECEYIDEDVLRMTFHIKVTEVTAA